VVRSPHPSVRTIARRGWTVLDVVLVAAILTVVAAAMGLMFRGCGYSGGGKIDEALSQAHTIEQAVNGYEMRFSRRPESLRQLVTPPDSGKHFVPPDGILDPWGRLFRYDPSGPRHGGTKPDIWTIVPGTGQEVGNFR
jgi:hypothetical protein